MSNYAKNNIKGATMVEYVLIAGLISIAAVALFTPIGTLISGVFTDIQTALTPAP